MKNAPACAGAFGGKTDCGAAGLVDDILVQQQHKLIHCKHGEELKQLLQRVPLYQQSQDQLARQFIAVRLSGLWRFSDLIGSGKAFFQCSEPSIQ